MARRGTRGGSTTREGTPRRRKKRRIAKNLEKQRQAVALAFDPKALEYRSLRDVAADMGETVPAVVSLLQEAYRNGMFAVLQRLPEETIEIIRLQVALKQKYGLRDVVLVEGVPSMLEDLDAGERRGVHNMVLRALAERLARYLDELVTAAAKRQHAAAGAGGRAQPFRLGVAWGRTCHLLAKQLLLTRRAVPRLDMEVLPIIGLTSTCNTERTEANVIAMDIAEAYHALPWQLPCQAFVPKMLVDVIVRSPQVADLLRRIKSADVVVTSMGAILDGGEDGSDIRLSNDPQVSRELVKSARAAGAVGEINYWCFGRNGNVVWTPDRAIGLGLGGLQDIVRDDPQKHREVILVTGGDKHRLEALQIALRAGFASVLLTDTVTARWLMGEISL